MNRWEFVGRNTKGCFAVTIGVATALVLLAAPPAALADSVVPLTINAWCEALAPNGGGEPDSYDAGWNYAHAGDMVWGVAEAWASCTNQVDGAVQIVDFETLRVLGPHGDAWSDSPDSTLVIGTTPENPAGAPLTLDDSATFEGIGAGGYFRLYRGSTLVYDRSFSVFDPVPEDPQIFAGETLRPTFAWAPDHSPSGTVTIDLTAVPEPATAALLAAGLLLATQRRR